MAFPTLSRGEESNKTSKTLVLKKDEKEPFFRGIYLSTDVFGYIYPIFVKDKYYSAEVSASANFMNRFCSKTI